MHEHESNPKRFAVALSFPGQHRRFVLRIAQRLAEELGRERVFYDEWNETDLLGLDGDLKLKRFYRDQSEFVIPFFSEHYRKPWCKVEWHSITNHLAEAEPLMRRALAIRKQSFGEEHPDYGTSLNDLGNLLCQTNRVNEGEQLLRQVLAIYESSFGPNHPWLATALNNLAKLLQAKAEEHDSESRATLLAEAEPMLRRAVEIFEASLGPDHPNTQTVAANHRRLLADMKKGGMKHRGTEGTETSKLCILCASVFPARRASAGSLGRQRRQPVERNKPQPSW